MSSVYLISSPEFVPEMIGISYQQKCWYVQCGKGSPGSFIVVMDDLVGFVF